MLVDVILFIVFLMVNIFVVGVNGYVYSGKEKYQDGMILGIHIPKEEVEHEQVRKICKDYQKYRKHVVRTGLWSSVFVCLLCFVSIGLFLIIYILWFVWFLAAVWKCSIVPMRKMYKLKEKNGWNVGNTENEYPAIVDDDQYWKKGWYENPNDKRLFVSDRICSSNYSMNMARTAGKVMTGGLVAVIAVTFIVILGLGVQLLELDLLGGVKVTFSEEKVVISASLYHDTFDLNKLEKVELKKKIPKDDYVRTNGADTDKYLLGHFRGKRLGNVMMFYDKKVECVLEIKVDGKILFLNGHSEQETKEWYEKMLNEI